MQLLADDGHPEPFDIDAKIKDYQTIMGEQKNANNKKIKAMCENTIALFTQLKVLRARRAHFENGMKPRPPKPKVVVQPKVIPMP
jgi:hypothetical protein